MKRLNKEKWLQTGLDILKKTSYTDIKIEYLCKRLKVTKGSFYHHFKNINDYYSKLFEYLFNTDRINLDRFIEDIPTPKGRLNYINRQIIKNISKEKVSLRAWGTHNKEVKKQLDKVDNMRIEYFTKLYLDTGLDPKKALIMARLNFALLVGIYQLFYNGSKSAIDELIPEINNLFN